LSAQYRQYFERISEDKNKPLRRNGILEGIIHGAKYAFFLVTPVVWTGQIIHYVQYAPYSMTPEALIVTIIADSVVCAIAGAAVGGGLGTFWQNLPTPLSNLFKFTFLGAAISNIAMLRYVHWNALDASSFAQQYQFGHLLLLYIGGGSAIGLGAGLIDYRMKITPWIRERLGYFWPTLEGSDAVMGETRASSYGGMLRRLCETTVVTATQFYALAFLGGLWGVLEAAQLEDPTLVGFDKVISDRIKFSKGIALVIGSMFFVGTQGNSQPIKSSQGQEHLIPLIEEEMRTSDSHKKRIKR